MAATKGPFENKITLKIENGFLLFWTFSSKTRKTPYSKKPSTTFTTIASVSPTKNISVAIGPGATQLAVIPLAFSSFASIFTIVSTAAFKSQNKNAKQLTWVLLLKAHRAAGCLTSIASAMFGLAAAIRRRVAAGKTDVDNDADARGNRSAENLTVKTRICSCIKVFLWLSVLLLGFDVAAYYKGWHFSSPYLQLHYPSVLDVKGLLDSLYSGF